MEYHFNKKQLWLFCIGFLILFFHLSIQIYNSGLQILLEIKNLEMLVYIILICIFFSIDIKYRIDKRGLYSELKLVFFGKKIFLKSNTIKWCKVRKVWSVFPYWIPSPFRAILLSVSFPNFFPISVISNYQEILLYMEENTNIPMDEDVQIIIEKYINKKSKKAGVNYKK